MLVETTGNGDRHVFGRLTDTDVAAALTVLDAADRDQPRRERHRLAEAEVRAGECERCPRCSSVEQPLREQGAQVAATVGNQQDVHDCGAGDVNDPIRLEEYLPAPRNAHRK